jgi:hypothetical protein
MKIFAIDTNLLVYAHNRDSPFHESAKRFIETVMNERDENGSLGVCIPAQVFIEFISVVTSNKLQTPLSISQATAIVQDYLDTEITILTQKDSYLDNAIELLGQVTSRKRIFDVAIVAILKDNQISGIYTANVEDFEGFTFLEAINPLAQS